MHPQALHPAPGLLASPQLPVQIQAAGKVRLVINPTCETVNSSTVLSVESEKYPPTDKTLIITQSGFATTSQPGPRLPFIQHSQNPRFYHK